MNRRSLNAMERCIHYLQGDATLPKAGGVRIIAHICNDLGGWGMGFVLALSARWAEPEKAYRRWSRERSGDDFALGGVQMVEVEPNLWVANMIGQHGVKPVAGVPPIRYEAVGQCLLRLGKIASDLSASVHMPRIGCGLAGGEWGRIEPLILHRLISPGVPVFVYDFSA